MISTPVTPTPVISAPGVVHRLVHRYPVTILYLVAVLDGIGWAQRLGVLR